MHTQVPSISKNSSETIEGTIFINGERNIQNQLLSDFISKETGYATQCNNCLNISNNVDCGGDTLVVLFDCTNKNPHAIWQEIGLNPELVEKDIRLILFNVDSKFTAELENEALGRGVRGVFFKESSIECLFKGIHSIIKGELWYSRKTLSTFLQKNINGNHTQYIPQTKLTKREQEILKCLVYGLSNADIAEKLKLSIHTVKTHIYNLYKKIEVPSRLQAVLWAAKNMPSDFQSDD